MPLFEQYGCQSLGKIPRRGQSRSGRRDPATRVARVTLVSQKRTPLCHAVGFVRGPDVNLNTSKYKAAKSRVRSTIQLDCDLMKWTIPSGSDRRLGWRR